MSKKPAKPKGKAKKAAKPAGKRAPFKAPVEAKTGKPPADTTKKEATIQRVTPAATLKSLLTTCRGYKANSDSIISKMREEIGFAVEKKHLDKGAFALLRKFDKMEAEKASELYHTFIRYMELSGVMTKIEAVGRLPLGDDDEAGEGDGAEAEAGAEGEGEKPAAEVAAKGKRKNGKDKPQMPPHPGIDPAEGSEEGNVSRPQFGGAAPPAAEAEQPLDVVKH